MRRLVLALAVVTGLISTVLTTPASATAIGREGKIAFVRSNQIFTMTKTGGTVKQLTTVGKNYRPKWSPDGKQIAYIQEDANGRKDVFKMTATGAKKTKVTQSGTVTSNPAWSPDGKTLAFGATATVVTSCQYYACYGTLYTIKATAPFGNPVAMVGWNNDLWDGGGPGDGDNPILVDRYLAWSPDGSKIAVFSHISGVWDDSLCEYTLATGENREIRGVGSDGTGYEDWSDLNYTPTGVFGFGDVNHNGEYDYGDLLPVITIVYPGFVSQDGDKAGAPSPSAGHMAFVRLNGTTPNIWTATMMGDRRKMIQANGYQPDWQPLP